MLTILHGRSTTNGRETEAPGKQGTREDQIRRLREPSLVLKSQRWEGGKKGPVVMKTDDPTRRQPVDKALISITFTSRNFTLQRKGERGSACARRGGGGGRS